MSAIREVSSVSK